MTHAPPLPDVSALDAHLRRALGAEAYPAEEQGGVWAPGDGRPVARLGLALEPTDVLGVWARAERLDALFVHRPWRLDVAALPAGCGVVWSHLPFDERLTTGDNPRLADALGLASRAPIGEKGGRPLGMLGEGQAAPARAWAERVCGAFGGAEAVHLPAPDTPVQGVAVVGAMTDALVREAARRGAGLYVTGQLRAPARDAVRETGLAVVATGHARAERWGLRALAHLLVERWGALRVAVAP